MTAEPLNQEGISPDVADTRLLLASSALLVVWIVTLVFVIQSWPVLLLGFAVPLITLVYRRRLLRTTAEPTEPADRLASLPATVTALTLILYGGILATVTHHNYQRSEAAYERKLAQYDQRTASLVAETEASTDAVQRGPNAHTRQSRKQEHEMTALEADINKLHKPAKLLSLMQSQHFAKTGLVGEDALILEHDARAELAEPKPRPPNPLAIPLWFGRLKSFFVVATQLLGAIVLVLVFTRWRTGTSEAVFRTVLPVEVAGLTAGLIANLPSLSLQVQAFLLAPVFAGLASALGALAVIALSPLEK
jgi:hypothetical protein